MPSDAAATCVTELRVTVVSTTRDGGWSVPNGHLASEEPELKQMRCFKPFEADKSGEGPVL